MKKHLLIGCISLVCSLPAVAQAPYHLSMQDAMKRKDTAVVVQHILDRVRRRELDSTGFLKVNTNNLLYSWMLPSTVDRSQLKEGAAYMRWVLRDQPKNPVERPIYANLIDTYANLLYKAGRRKKAIHWEMKALDYLPADQQPPLLEMIDKMKRRQPTWRAPASSEGGR